MGNIVWIASYPKSGNTWVRAFLENYTKNSAVPIDINSLYKSSISESSTEYYQQYVDETTKLEDLTIEKVCALRKFVHQDIASSAAGSIFVKTHNYLGEFRGEKLHNSNVTSGAIYIVRNPLDVVVSMSKYFDLSIDAAIEFLASESTGTPMEKTHVPQIISSWSSHVESWTGQADPSVLVLRYEDLVKDSKKWFRKIESFLRLKKDPKRLKSAITSSSFNQLRQQEKANGFIEKHENANKFFNKGTPNQWKAILNDSQIQKIVDVHSEQMSRFGYMPK